MILKAAAKEEIASDTGRGFVTSETLIYLKVPFILILTFIKWTIASLKNTRSMCAPRTVSLYDIMNICSRSFNSWKPGI